MTKINMDVAGMHCGACATGIQMIVSGIDGVSSAFVNYDSKKATFEFDEGKVSLDKIKEEVVKLGYTVTEST
jgi:copper chaperone CopZ